MLVGPRHIPSMKKSYLIPFITLCILITTGAGLRAQNDPSVSRAALSANPILNVYPQPASNILYLEFPGTQVSQPQIDMYDMIGNLQEKVQAERINPVTFTINLNGKRAGFYFLRIRNEEGSWSRRITVRP